MSAASPSSRRTDRERLRRLVAVAAGLTLGFFAHLASSQQTASEDVAEPTGYRLGDYRAATPKTVSGGEAIDTAGAADLWRGGDALWIDVLAAPRRPPELAPQAVWKPLARRDIPGSLWLPDVGRGALSAALEGYFRDNLARATGADAAKPIVFYCLADCWMSWNAAKRAAGWGYRKVYWYRDGTDGWQRAGLPTEEATPLPGAP
jgi:PQQ-dependent catabolism-associated CXXCW motif protein